jgi:hypothetical protein
MRVRDAENGIRDVLSSMDWYHYLCAMWMICGEFQAGYNSRPRSADHVECDDDAMMDAVLTMTRSVVSAGTVSPEAAREAGELWRRWQALIQRNDPDIMDLAQWRLWLIFADLMGEIAGSRRNYGARAKMNATIRDLWKDDAGPQPGAVWVNNPNEEIADGSARARALARVQRIVGVVATAGELDPVAIKALVPPDDSPQAG